MCTGCNQGSHLQPGETICLPECPSGFIKTEEQTCDGTLGLVDCIEFANKTVSATILQLRAQGNETVPENMRGHWFNEAYIEIHDLFLHVTFTVAVWARPENVLSGTLFAIWTDTESVLKFEFDNEKLKLTYTY